VPGPAGSSSERRASASTASTTAARPSSEPRSVTSSANPTGSRPSASQLSSTCSGAERRATCSSRGNGRYLAAGTFSGEVCVWQLADWTRIVSTQRHKGLVYGIEWASDGHLLATCGNDGTVKLWEAQTGQLSPPWKAIQVWSGTCASARMAA
jgi:WD40 repeat protein